MTTKRMKHLCEAYKKAKLNMALKPDDYVPVFYEELLSVANEYKLSKREVTILFEAYNNETISGVPTFNG